MDKNRQQQKLLMLGLDAALPDLIMKFTKEGSMPVTQRLIKKGWFARMITTFPPLTAAAWGAITSGAGPGTAGIPSLMVHKPGEPLDKWHTSFCRHILEAETLWEAAGKVGKKTVLVNWPVTWPLGVENGIQLAASLNPPFRYFYMPLWDIAPSALFSTNVERCNQTQGRAVQVKPRPAKDWSNLPRHSGEAMEIMIDTPPVYAKGPQYYVLLLDSEGKGYDQAVISQSRDVAEAVAILQPGEKSGWINETFTDAGGIFRKGRFYFYLVSMKDLNSFKLYQSAVNTAEAITLPPELTEELYAAAGPYIEVDDPWGYMDGWIDIDFYLDQLTAQNDWWERATGFALNSSDWDMAFSWVGTIDHIQHVFYGGIDPQSCHYNPHEAPVIMEHVRRVYSEVDERIGHILKQVDLDNTLICLVSDHGFSSLERSPYIKHHLAKAGLLTFDLDNQTGAMHIDWSKTKCYPLEPGHAHIYINLKGRDPQGIVAPEDYEKVQEEVIDVLMSLRDPVTGRKVVSTALRKQESGTLGVFENQGYDRVGDVLFALKPQYMANPFVYPAAVKYRDGTERYIPNPEDFEPARLHRNFTGVHLSLPYFKEMHAAVVLSGKGIPIIKRKNPINIIDLAPTLAYLLGTPTPKDAEGNILKEMVKMD
ncbi:MAG: alkaline phosphatase family protein [Deltaproteobacteria bacterium]|nr:MAG: alkaline phosphatase family protein [Deltaproteobacteria bacterium]